MSEPNGKKKKTSENASGYTGYAITCIKTTPVEGSEDLVEFSEEDDSGSEAVFITDIQQISKPGAGAGYRKFRAKRIRIAGEGAVTTEEMTKMIRNPPKPPGIDMTEDVWKSKWKNAIPLFCVHGFNNEPSEIFDSFETRYKFPKTYVQEIFAEKGGVYYPIPVLWPCHHLKSMFGYETVKADGKYEYDKQEALNAGDVLEKFTESISNDLFPEKALLAHSMGNHVVFDGGCEKKAPDVQFNDIYLVAADIPYDVFHKDPKDDYDNERQKKAYQHKKKKAGHFFEMLAGWKEGKAKGKVHILNNVYDLALLASCDVLNDEPRLGQKGVGQSIKFLTFTEDKTLVRDEFSSHLVNVNFACKRYKLLNHANTMKDYKCHSYQFEDFTVEYISSKVFPCP